MVKISVPLQDPNLMLEFDVNEIGLDTLFDILRKEKTPLKYWNEIALEYYRANKLEDFLQILETARTDAFIDYCHSEHDRMTCLDRLAAFNIQQAKKEKDKTTKKALLNKASDLYIIGESIRMYDRNHLLGMAYFNLLEGNRISEAEYRFDFVCSDQPNNIAAKIGKALVYCQKNDYRNALKMFQEALRTNPKCPPDVKLGIGVCFYKIGKFDKARQAFERTLEIDEKCVGALIGLAVLELNCSTLESIPKAIQYLSYAYVHDRENSVILNHLANHYFYKKKYNTAEQLALHALYNTENEAIQAETFYQLARIYHVRLDFDKAFKFYYQATLFSVKNFILPYYGLGQMHLMRGEEKKAAECFEKILNVNPTDVDTIRILASIYAKSRHQAEIDRGKVLLKEVTRQCPNDMDSWIELAQILEQSDLKGSLSIYCKVAAFLSEKGKERVPPEMLNNIATLHFKLGNFLEAKKCYEASLFNIEKSPECKKQHYKAISVTVTYNLARVYESLHLTAKAESQYKNILKAHPNYTDCYLRLGCISRDKGLIYEASDWFKEAIRIDQGHADAWLLLGNLHFSKGEWGPAQKKYEHTLKQEATVTDVYALIALGNVWLRSLFQGKQDKIKDELYQERALKLYRQVLKLDHANIWAANGIGCILAYKGYINEAYDCFIQVRETTSNFFSVQLNIAHIYMEQKQYRAAIQMYKNCITTFMKTPNVEMSLYLAKAYYKCEMYTECKQVLVEARQVYPLNEVLIYNLAVVLMKLAEVILQDQNASIATLLSAIYELNTAHGHFELLSIEKPQAKHNPAYAAVNASYCQDLMNQAQHHIAHAKKLEEEMCLRKELEDKKRQENLLMLEKQQREEMEKEIQHKKEMYKHQQLVLQQQITICERFHKGKLHETLGKKHQKNSGRKSNLKESDDLDKKNSCNTDEGINDVKADSSISEPAAKKCRRT